MENSKQDACIDSPMLHQTPLRRPQTPQRMIPPTSTCSEVTVTHQTGPPAYTSAPYLDSPPQTYHDSPSASSDAPCSRLQQQPLVFHVSTPADYQHPSTPSQPSRSDDEDDDEDVPLAQLLLYPCDAPPAYSAVVRQSYRETLLQYVSRHPAAVDSDEEAVLERIRADDVSFGVERAVASAVVTALLVLAGILVGLMLFRR